MGETERMNQQRKGQRLVNYIRFKKLDYKDGEALVWDINKVVSYQAMIERIIFNMPDKEFEEAMKFGD